MRCLTVQSSADAVEEEVTAGDKRGWQKEEGGGRVTDRGRCWEPRLVTDELMRRAVV